LRLASLNRLGPGPASACASTTADVSNRASFL
jgi:hypothetical protein